MNDFPEHEKIDKVKDKSQAIGAFLEWLSYTKGYFIAEGDSDGLHHTGISIQQILAEYFEIDLNLIEREKRKMLEILRERNREEENVT